MDRFGANAGHREQNTHHLCEQAEAAVNSFDGLVKGGQFLGERLQGALQTLMYGGRHGAAGHTVFGGCFLDAATARHRGAAQRLSNWAAASSIACWAAT
ncbi:MAG: hypothetical protein R3A44_41940 [Caldilineaceae bacterium]